MFKCNNLLITFALLVLLITGGSMANAAKAEQTFGLSVSSKANLIQVVVKGHGLEDMYAYQFKLEYDSKLLRFQGASTPINGFTIEPIVKQGSLVFAHTKTGDSAATTGNAILATITFERINSGETAFLLKDVKLVNTKLVMSELKDEVKSTETSVRKLFTDIDGHWAQVSIINAAQLGWITGYEDDTFRPQRPITRAEFAVMLTRVLNLPLLSNDPDFTDLALIPSWAKSYVASTAKAKIIQGHEDGAFRADKLITRAEMAAMVVRAHGIELKPGIKPKFVDTNTIQQWAQPYVAVAVEQGWIKGRGNNVFAPQQQATRAEAVMLLLTFSPKEI